VDPNSKPLFQGLRGDGGRPLLKRLAAEDLSVRIAGVAGN
jgi:hypothetical protein